MSANENNVKDAWNSCMKMINVYTCVKLMVVNDKAAMKV